MSPTSGSFSSSSSSGDVNLTPTGHTFTLQIEGFVATPASYFQHVDQPTLIHLVASRVTRRGLPEGSRMIPLASYRRFPSPISTSPAPTQNWHITPTRSTLPLVTHHPLESTPFTLISPSYPLSRSQTSSTTTTNGHLPLKPTLLSILNITTLNPPRRIPLLYSTTPSTNLLCAIHHPSWTLRELINLSTLVLLFEDPLTALSRRYRPRDIRHHDPSITTAIQQQSPTSSKSPSISHLRNSARPTPSLHHICSVLLPGCHSIADLVAVMCPPTGLHPASSSSMSTSNTPQIGSTCKPPFWTIDFTPLLDPSRREIVFQQHEGTLSPAEIIGWVSVVTRLVEAAGRIDTVALGRLVGWVTGVSGRRRRSTSSGGSSSGRSAGASSGTMGGAPGGGEGRDPGISDFTLRAVFELVIERAEVPEMADVVQRVREGMVGCDGGDADGRWGWRYSGDRGRVIREVRTGSARLGVGGGGLVRDWFGWAVGGMEGAEWDEGRDGENEVDGEGGSGGVEEEHAGVEMNMSL